VSEALPEPLRAGQGLAVRAHDKAASIKGKTKKRRLLDASHPTDHPILTPQTDTWSQKLGTSSGAMSSPVAQPTRCSCDT
jgi:hypothetical protein